MIIILSSAKIPFPGKVHSLVLGAKLRLFVVVVHSVMYDSAARQASLCLTICQSLLKLMSIESVMPSNHHILYRPLFLLPSVFHSMRVFSNEVAKVLEFQPQYQSFQQIFRTYFLQDGLVGSPCSPKDSQESSPTPQLKRINSSALSFLYSPTLTSIHDYWKNHSFDQMDLCWQSNVSAF